MAWSPEARKKMSRIQKKLWREKRAMSKAEVVVKKAAGKEAGTNRLLLYQRASQAAAAAGEMHKLAQAMSNALFLDMWLGRNK